MSDARGTPKNESARRLDAERRVARALVANYIHELSDRHGAADQEPGRDGELERRADPSGE